MGAVPLAARLVEVIADQGAERYMYGSGCIVRGRTVLTAAHVVAEAVRVQIRDPYKRLYSASSTSRVPCSSSFASPSFSRTSSIRS